MGLTGGRTLFREDSLVTPVSAEGADWTGGRTLFREDSLVTSVSAEGLCIADWSKRTCLILAAEGGGEPLRFFRVGMSNVRLCLHW